jgi:hypothetical protein
MQKFVWMMLLSVLSVFVIYLIGAWFDTMAFG